MRICGVVVIYNPTEEVLLNINSYSNLVDKLFICDNSDQDNIIINQLNMIKNIEFISMNGNQGIAKALKTGLDRACSEEFDYCLTMDQDSVFPTDRFTEIETYLRDLYDDYAIIGLNFNSNSFEKKIVNVNMWLTSGNFINIKYYKLIDGFKEELFIDYVDIELNEQFYKINKKICYINDISLKHTIGNPIVKKIFGKKITSMNHTPIRYYYRYRNGLYLYKKNKQFYKKKYRHDLYIDIVKILLFEKNKRKKFQMIKRGRKDAKKGILGKYTED